MTIILAGVFSVPWSTNAFMRKYLERLGHTVVAFDIDWPHPRPLGPAGRAFHSAARAARSIRLGARLLDLADRVKPDAVIIAKGKRLDPEVTRALSSRTTVVYWYIDASLPDYAIAHAKASHLVMVTGGHLVGPLRAGTGRDNVRQAFEGCDPEIHRTAGFDQRYACDIAFTGAPLPDRIALLRRCQTEGYRVKIWGQPGWPRDLQYTGQYAYNEKLAAVCASAAVVLGSNSRNDCRGYFSDRAFLVLASRGFFVTRYVPGLERFFENGRQLAWFHDERGLMDLLRLYLGDEQRRRTIAQTGQSLVYEKYTWRQSMAHLALRISAVRKQEGQ